MNHAGAGQFPPPPPPAPQEFDVEQEATENEAWEEAALADTIAVFDAATAEEARRHWAEDMGEQWRAERERLRMERELHHRERRESLEQRRREEAAWAAEADALAAVVAAQMEEDEEEEEEEEEAEEDDNDNFDWSGDDGPDPDEAAAK
jgi:hypothetical protein